VICRYYLEDSELVVYSEGEPHGERRHESVHVHAVISSCLKCRRMQIERLVHDCFPFDDYWDFYGWSILEPEEADAVRLLLNETRIQPYRWWPERHQRARAVLAESCRLLPFSEWSAPLPDWSSRERLARNTFRAKLAKTSDGYTVIIAVEG
jgi:hypothetical protein